MAHQVLWYKVTEMETNSEQVAFTVGVVCKRYARNRCFRSLNHLSTFFCDSPSQSLNLQRCYIAPSLILDDSQHQEYVSSYSPISSLSLLSRIVLMRKGYTYISTPLSSADYHTKENVLKTHLLFLCFYNIIHLSRRPHFIPNLRLIWLPVVRRFLPDPHLHCPNPCNPHARAS